ncbi:MAG: hypothetical protein R8K50_02775 [Mariprofundus sp.]
MAYAKALILCRYTDGNRHSRAFRMFFCIHHDAMVLLHGIEKKTQTADIRQVMDENNISKAQIARGMHTARPVVDRLLDPINTGITLKTIAKAAAVPGGQIRVPV